MSQNMLHEISRHSIKINKYQETTLSWHNFILTVNTDKDIYFFSLSYNLQCLDKNIDCLESSISTPTYSPAASLLSNEFIKNGMRNIDFTQTIIDSELWFCNTQLTQELTSIVSYMWSPMDFINNNQCVLATLNTIGNVELFQPQRYNWKSIFNLSSIIEKYFQPTIYPFGYTDTFPENLEQLKKAACTVETSAICWGPKTNQMFSYFVTAQKNGSILIWSLQSQEMDVKAELLGYFPTEHPKVISMLWIPKTENQFLLVCSKVNGQIFACDFQIADNKIDLLQTVLLWTHKDRMVAKYLQYSKVGDKIIIIFNKNKHLLVQMLDNSCEIKAQYINNVNDYRIVAITESNNEFYLGTINCKIYKIEFIILDKSIDVRLIPLQIKDTYATHELYGVSFSSNNMLCALAIVDRQIMHRKEPLKIDVIFLCYETGHENEISTLINNPTKKLTYLWGCIELLRYKTMKLKVLPNIDFNQLYKDGNNDIYKLKIYLILVILYNNLEKIIQNGSRGLLPETSIEVVKERILVLHAATVINNLCNKFKRNGNFLNDFDTESYLGVQKFLNTYCHIPKKTLSSLVSSDVLNLIQKDIQYTCQCCEENLEDFSCKNGHMNMICPITFTPIEEIGEKTRALINKTDSLTTYLKNDDGSIQYQVIINDNVVFDRKITLNKEEDFVTPDGGKSKITFTLDGDVLTSVMKSESGRAITMVRTFEGNGMRMDITVEGLKGVIVYEAI